MASPYGVHQMIHGIHMHGDIQKLVGWYMDIFDAYVFRPINYLSIEKRDATLGMVSNFCVEPMAPRAPIDESTPVGRFYKRFGSRWHSIGFKVDDFKGLAKHLREMGIRLAMPGGGMKDEPDENLHYFYPHPKDAFGSMIEVASVTMPGDPTRLPGWNTDRWLNHPLGIKGLWSLAIAVDNMEGAKRFYVEGLGGDVLHEEVSNNNKSVFVFVGDETIVELVTPANDQSELKPFLIRYGPRMYSVTMRVKDLDAAAKYLAPKHVHTKPIGNDTIMANEEDTLGALYKFTTRVFKNDPRKWAQ